MPQKHFMVALKLTKRRKNSKPHLDKKKNYCMKKSNKKKNYCMKKSKNSTQISKKPKFAKLHGFAYELHFHL